MAVYNRSLYHATIDPSAPRVMSSSNLDDITGRFFDKFHVRGNTLVCVPGAKDQNVPPMGVTTWLVSDIVQALQQAYAERIIDDDCFNVLDRILVSTFDGVYIDRDYLCPKILVPSQMTQIRPMLCELALWTTWTWEGWLSLEDDMNREGIAHTYDGDYGDDDVFKAHIDRNITIVEEDVVDILPFPEIDTFDIDINDVLLFEDVLSEITI
jgi:hypothetical protein